MSRDLGYYIALCSVQGELSPDSYLHVSIEDLRARAVFLRDYKSYSYYYDLGAKFDISLWAAIASELPELQAVALTTVHLNPHKGKILGECYDPLSIPWTPQLVREVGELLHGLPFNEIRPNTSLLKGFLRVSPRVEDSFYQWIIGRVQAKYGDSEISTEDPEIEELLKNWSEASKIEMWSEDINDPDLSVASVRVISGYIYGLDQYGGPNRPILLGLAIGHCRAIALTLLTQGFPNLVQFQGYIIDERMQKRVRALLANPDQLQSLLKPPGGPEFVRDYRIIAGEVTTAEANPVLRDDIGNPGPKNDQLYVEEDVIVPQTILRNYIYDPLYSALQDDPEDNVKSLAQSVTYMQGNGDFIVDAVGLSREEDGPITRMKRKPSDFNPLLLQRRSVQANSTVFDRTYQQILARLQS